MGEVLNSWKEVAAYLGRGVRTVQRWELELGLPVRRPRGKSRSAVIALKADLDRWLKQAPQGINGYHGNPVVEHLQLRRNTELLRLRTVAVMAQSKKLQEKMAESIAMAEALTRKRPAQPKHIDQDSADAHEILSGRMARLNGRAVS